MLESPIQAMVPPGDPPTKKRRGSGGTVSGEECKRRRKGHQWPHKPLKKAAKKRKSKRRCVRARLEAPFNSTQFIMQEHDLLSDTDLSSSKRPPPRRTRDSSLSLESEDPEEEEGSSGAEDAAGDLFLSQQFWSAFQDSHAERLDAMTRTQLVQEYFALEEVLTQLERELEAARERDRRRIQEAAPGGEEDLPAGEEEEDMPPGEVAVDPETAAKIEIFRAEIQSLEEENARLRREARAPRRLDSSSSEEVEGGAPLPSKGAAKSYGADSGIASGVSSCNSSSGGEDALGSSSKRTLK